MNNTVAARASQRVREDSERDAWESRGESSAAVRNRGGRDPGPSSHLNLTAATVNLRSLQTSGEEDLTASLGNLFWEEFIDLLHCSVLLLQDSREKKALILI